MIGYMYYQSNIKRKWLYIMIYEIYFLLIMTIGSYVLLENEGNKLIKLLMMLLIVLPTLIFNIYAMIVKKYNLKPLIFKELIVNHIN